MEAFPERGKLVTREQVAVQQANDHEGETTLGVALARYGNNKAALEHMKENASAWHDKVVTGTPSQEISMVMRCHNRGSCT